MLWIISFSGQKFTYNPWKMWLNFSRLVGRQNQWVVAVHMKTLVSSLPASGLSVDMQENETNLGAWWGAGRERFLYYLITQPTWLLWNELMRDIASPTIIRMQVFSECARCLAFIIWKFLSFPAPVKGKPEHVQQNYKQLPVGTKTAAYLMSCVVVIVSPANECIPCYFREVAGWQFLILDHWIHMDYLSEKGILLF